MFTLWGPNENLCSQNLNQKLYIYCTFIIFRNLDIMKVLKSYIKDSKKLGPERTILINEGSISWIYSNQEGRSCSKGSMKRCSIVVLTRQETRICFNDDFFLVNCDGVSSMFIVQSWLEQSIFCTVICYM